MSHTEDVGNTPVILPPGTKIVLADQEPAAVAPKESTIKPGIRTSEYWTSLVALALGFATSTGHLSAGDSATLADACTRVVGGVIAAASVIMYIYSRVKAKAAQPKVVETTTIKTESDVSRSVEPIPLGPAIRVN